MTCLTEGFVCPGVSYFLQPAKQIPALLLVDAEVIVVGFKSALMGANTNAHAQAHADQVKHQANLGFGQRQGKDTVGRRQIYALLRMPLFVAAWIAAFAYFPLWLASLALAGWVAKITPGIRMVKDSTLTSPEKQNPCVRRSRAATTRHPLS